MQLGGWIELVFLNLNSKFFSKGRDADSDVFSEVFEGSEADLVSCLRGRNQEGFLECPETVGGDQAVFQVQSLCVFRGLPETVDLEGDDMEDLACRRGDPALGVLFTED